jgi:Undecaprenyl-phosphate glucose phosphotransferase
MQTPLVATQAVVRAGSAMADGGAPPVGQVLVREGDRERPRSYAEWLDALVQERAGNVANTTHDRPSHDQLFANGAGALALATEAASPRSAENALRVGPSNLVLAVEAGLIGQSFWLVDLIPLGGRLGQDFGLGASLTMLLAAIVFFFVKKAILTDGWRGLAVLHSSFRASLLATVAVAVVLTPILALVAATPATGVASGALGLAFALATTALCDSTIARSLRRIQAGMLDRRTRRVAFLGHEHACRSLAQRLSKIQGDRRIVGIFALAEGEVDADVVSAVVELARDGEIEEVVVAPHSLDDPLFVPAIEQLSAYPIDILLSPGAIGLAVADLARGPGSPIVPLLPLVRQPIRGWGADAKRTLDVVLSSLALTLLLPIFGMIALAIKLDSPGPVLFRQKRTGLNQKPFFVWKFRTMRCGSDGMGGAFRQACRGDARVTRVGRLLRQFSADELPQLVNVLRGEMSLVGPRPHPEPLNERFANQVALFSARHRVLPGITGLAQIHGCRGETDTLEKMTARLRYDLQYIRNWSLWLDLRIIALTLLGRFTHSNAY